MAVSQVCYCRPPGVAGWIARSLTQEGPLRDYAIAFLCGRRNWAILPGEDGKPEFVNVTSARWVSEGLEAAAKVDGV